VGKEKNVNGIRRVYGERKWQGNMDRICVSPKLSRKEKHRKGLSMSQVNKKRLEELDD